MKIEAPPPLPESPSTSNCSRPSRSSARAARVLSRVSLEDSEDDNSEEEDHHHRPQPSRKSRKRVARHTHAHHEGSDSQPGYTSNDNISLDFKDRVPSLKIKLPDTVPNTTDELPKRKEDSSSAKRESSNLTDNRVSVDNQTLSKKYLIEPVKEICVPENFTSVRVPVTSVICDDASDRKLSLKVIPSVSSCGKTLIKEREQKYPSENSSVTAVSAELQPIVSLKRIQHSGEQTVLKDSVKSESLTKSSDINSQNKCINSIVPSVEVHEQQEKEKFSELRIKENLSSISPQKQKYEVTKSSVNEPITKVQSDKDSLPIVETHSAVNKASVIKSGSESVLVKGEPDHRITGTVLQTINKVEKAKKLDCNAVEVTKQLSNLPTREANDPKLLSTVTVSKLDKLNVTEVSEKKSDLLNSIIVKDLGDIRKALSCDSLSVEVIHVPKGETVRNDCLVEEVSLKSTEPFSHTSVAPATKVPLTHGPVKAKIWEKLLDTAQKKGDPVKDFSKQGSKDSSPKGDSDQSEGPESYKVKKDVLKEVEKESETQESILQKLVISKVSDFEPTSHSITSLLSTSNKDRERERGGIKEIKRLQLGGVSGTEDLQTSHHLPGYIPPLALSTLCADKEADPSLLPESAQQSKGLSDGYNIKSTPVLSSETEAETLTSTHSQVEKTAIHGDEKVIQKQFVPVGRSSNAPKLSDLVDANYSSVAQPSTKSAQYSVKSFLPKSKNTLEDPKLQSSNEELDFPPTTEGSNSQISESKCTKTLILSSKSEVSNILDCSKQISSSTSTHISKLIGKTQTSCTDTQGLEAIGTDKYIDSSDISKTVVHKPSKEVKVFSSVIQPLHKFKSIESLISDKCETENKEDKKVKQQIIVASGTNLESAQNTPLCVEVGDKLHTFAEKDLSKVTKSITTTSLTTKLVDIGREESISNSELAHVASKYIDIEVSSRKEGEKSTSIEKKSVDEIDKSIFSVESSTCILGPRDTKVEQFDTPVEKTNVELKTSPILSIDRQSLVKEPSSPFNYIVKKDSTAPTPPSESARVVKVESNIVSDSAKRKVKPEEKTKSSAESKSYECLTEIEVHLESKSEAKLELDLESKEFVSKSVSAGGPETKALEEIGLEKDPTFGLKSKEASGKACLESTTELGDLKSKKEDNLDIKKSVSNEANNETDGVSVIVGTQLSSDTSAQNPKITADSKLIVHEVGVSSDLKGKTSDIQDLSLSEIQTVVEDTSRDNRSFDKSTGPIRLKQLKEDQTNPQPSELTLESDLSFVDKSFASSLNTFYPPFASEGSSQEAATSKVCCIGKAASEVATSSLKVEVHHINPPATTHVTQKIEVNPAVSFGFKSEKSNLSTGENKTEDNFVRTKLKEQKFESPSKPYKQESGTVNTTVAEILQKNEGDIVCADNIKIVCDTAVDNTESSNIVKAESVKNLRVSCPVSTDNTDIEDLSVSVCKEEVGEVATNTTYSKDHLVLGNFKTETNTTSNSSEGVTCLDTKTETDTTLSFSKSEDCQISSGVIKPETNITLGFKSGFSPSSGATIKESNTLSTQRSEIFLTDTNIIKTEANTTPVSSKSEASLTGTCITKTVTDAIESCAKSEACPADIDIIKTETSTTLSVSNSEVYPLSLDTVKVPYTTDIVLGNEVGCTDLEKENKTEKNTSKTVFYPESTNITGTGASSIEGTTKVCLIGRKIKTEGSATPSCPKSPFQLVNAGITETEKDSTQHFPKSEGVEGANSVQSSPKSKGFPPGIDITQTTSTPSRVCTASTDSPKESSIIPSSLESGSRLGRDLTKFETNTIQSSLTNLACSTATGITKTETSTTSIDPESVDCLLSTDTDKSSITDTRNETKTFARSHKSGVSLLNRDRVKEADILSDSKGEICFPGTKNTKDEISTTHIFPKSEACSVNINITKTETSTRPNVHENEGSVNKEVTKTEENTSSSSCKTESCLIINTDTTKRKGCLVNTDTTKGRTCLSDTTIRKTESTITKSSY